MTPQVALALLTTPQKVKVKFWKQWVSWISPSVLLFIPRSTNLVCERKKVGSLWSELMIGFGEDCRKEWVWMKTYLPTADVKSYFRGWTLKPKPPFSGGEKVRIAESETSSKMLLLPSRQLAFSIITTSRPAISAEVHFPNWLVNFLCNLSLLWIGLPSHSLLCATAVLEIPRRAGASF